MDKLGWLIGCLILDVAVILTNVCEHVFIIKRWKYLDRIDHLLLSLSVSDLIFGLSTFTIDSWYLSRDLLLNDTTHAHNLVNISANINITSNADNYSMTHTSCFAKFFSGKKKYSHWY